MKIKKFNESNDHQDKIYMVLVYDVGGDLKEEECRSFSSQILAADYYIKWVNYNYDKSFEPFFEDDGTRLFLWISENPDYKECIELVDEISEYLEIITIPSTISSPQKYF